MRAHVAYKAGQSISTSFDGNIDLQTSHRLLEGGKLRSTVSTADGNMARKAHRPTNERDAQDLDL